MRVVYKLCTHCGKSVLCNGPGSSSTLWNRRMTWLLGKLYPITQNLFFKASTTHDMAYHRGSLSGNRDFDREMADENFKRDCIDAVHISRHPIVRLFKPWFFWQAEKYFIAVRLFGNSIYPRCSCSEKKQRMKNFP